MTHHLATSGAVAQDERGVKRHENIDIRHRVVREETANEFFHRTFSLVRQDVSNRRRSQEDEVAWTNQLDLPPQVRKAAGDFIPAGRAVLWRTTLDDVGDEHIFLRFEARLPEHLVEVLSRCSNESPSLSVLFGSGAFTDQHHGRLRIATVDDQVRAPTVKGAEPARGGRQRVSKRGVVRGGEDTALRRFLGSLSPTTIRLGLGHTVLYDLREKVILAP